MVVFAHEDKKLIPTCVKENMSNPGDLGRFFSPLRQRFNTQIHNPVDLQLSTVDAGAEECFIYGAFTEVHQ